MAIASLINGIADVVLCLFLYYGITGAAYGQLTSQTCRIYGFLKDKGYNSYAITFSSANY
ncbi:hypothetical protein Hanom_Chr14g01314221 [Helianthus anomalus]